MSPTVTPPDPRKCENVGELLSWHANGTLGPADRALVDAHTAVCDTCRTALAVERRIVETMRTPRDNVEQSPHAGWQKLVARLDADGAVSPGARGSADGSKADVARSADSSKTQIARSAIGEGSKADLAKGSIADALKADAARGAGVTAGLGVSREPGAGRAGRGRVNWPAALGAAVAVQAAAIAVLAVALVRHRQVDETPRFHTVADADPTLRESGSLVRIAFDRSVDEETAHRIAQSAAARISAGPSPDNVYTFVFAEGTDAAGGLDQKVSSLRRQAHVLLVEPVVVGYPRSGK
jgi:hypothetical protein